MKKIKDHFFWQAKKEGYIARSIYKLREFDEKYNFIKKGSKVIELGSAPGSWLQYTKSKVGKNGFILAIDSSPLKINIKESIIFLQEDVNKINTENIVKEYGKFDILLSDLAPRTSGIKAVDQQNSYILNLEVLNIAKNVLRFGSSIFIKIFQSSRIDDFKKLLQLEFKRTFVFKPKSSRKESFEIFLAGINFKEISDK